ncbi:MAG TPA: ion transporter [Coriobacteriia bacterium]|nr:ion transporter [Coriobacteriia bacterium]
MDGSLKRRIYEALETDEGQDEYYTLRAFLAVFIVLNLISVALSTIPWFVERYARGLIAFEIISVAIISVELGLRVWACTEDPRYARPVAGRLRYLVRPMTLIDLISIAPSLFSVLGLDLRFLRVFRLLRLLRVLKLGRYSEGLVRLDDVIWKKRGELVSALLLISILLTLISGLMYFAEHEAQPEAFSTLPEALWWSTMMMTGEFAVSPVTPFGRLLGMAIAMLGVGLFALPAGIIASGFLEELQDEEREEGRGGGRLL